MPGIAELPKDDPTPFWQHIHGASVHFPIALILVALLFDFGALVMKREHWRPIGFWCLLIAVLGSLPAIVSGLSGQFGWFGVTKFEGDKLMPIHRNYALVGAGCAMVALLIRAVRRDHLSQPLRIVALVLVLASAVAIGFAGFLGSFVRGGY